MPGFTRGRTLIALLVAVLLMTLLVQAPASALPGAPTGLTPDGDDVTENPVLHWDPVVGATSYRVQASVSPTFSPTLYNTTTVNTNFTPYNAIPTGTIYWRVAAIDGTGTGEYAEAQFTRTLIGPDQLTPADDPGGAAPLAFPGTPIRFSWESGTEFNSYELQVDDAADFVGATVVKTDATTYTLPTTKVPGQNFFWRVRGATDSGASGVLSEWSDTWEFRTSWDTTAGLVKPADNTAVSITDIELEWTAVLGADHYELQIAKDINFNTIELSVSTVYGTRYSPPDTLDNTSYHWRVRPVDVDGHVGTWSQTAPNNPFSFTRAWNPAPTIVSPTTSLTNPPIYRWTPTVAPSAAQSESVYEVEVDTNPGFPSPDTCVTTHTSAYFYDSDGGSTGSPGECDSGMFDLDAGTTYYWRVRGIDEPSGIIGIWSSIEDFTYVGPPGPTGVGTMTTPTLLTPLDCDTDCEATVSTSPVFSWNAVAEADYYLIVVANDANFTNIHSRWRVDDFTTFKPNSEFEDNDAGEAYYWHVRACDDLTPDVCSPSPEGTIDPYSFAFQKRSYEVTLTAPAHDPVGLPESPIANLPRFSWQDYQDTNLAIDPTADVSAEQYRIQVATDPAFEDVIDTAVVDQTFYTPYNKTYPEGPMWWRVQAIDGSDNDLTWSNSDPDDEAWRFLKSSPAPSQSSPANAATVGQTPTFDWTDQSFAAEYVIEVYENDPTMTFPSANRIINVTTTYSEWTDDDFIPAGTDYSWRVRREDGQGKDGPWSAGRTFDVVADATVLGLNPCDDAVLPDNDIIYSWDALDDAVTYRFERSDTSTFASVKESRVTVTTKWAPTAALANGEWFWRVVPLDAGDDAIGDPADWTVCRVVKGSLPSAPTTLGITANPGQLIVSWGAPVSAGDPAFDHYRVTLNPGGITRTMPTTVRSTAFNGLINQTNYTVNIYAVSDIGDSPPLFGGGTPNGCDDTPFSDVEADHTFCTEIAWMYTEGISTGSLQGDGRIMYQPSAPVTRQAMASFLWKFHDSPPPGLPTPFFADVAPFDPGPPESGNRFYDAIQWMAETGLSTGTPNPPGKPLYKPAEAVSRQAMSAFLHRDAGDDPPISVTPYFADVGPSNVFFEDIQWMNESGLSTGTPNPPGKPLYKPLSPVSRQAMAAFLFRYDDYLTP